MSRRVDVLIPTYRHLSAKPYNAILSMLNYTKESGYSVAFPALFAGGVIHFTRNDSLRHVRRNADFVLFCDDDMVPEKDSLVRLLERDLPAVSALCTTRSLPVELCIKSYNEAEDRFVTIDQRAFDVSAVISGQIAAGTGFLLVRKDVIDRVREFYLSAEDWYVDNIEALRRMGASVDAIHTEKERISAARVALVKQRGIETIFHYHRCSDESELGEDISFCRRLLQLKIPIAVDTTVQVGHSGEYAFGPWNVDDGTTDTAGTPEEATPHVETAA